MSKLTGVDEMFSVESIQSSLSVLLVCLCVCVCVCRAVLQPDDYEARAAMHMAATTAGIGFNSAGVHLW